MTFHLPHSSNDFSLGEDSKSNLSSSFQVFDPPDEMSPNYKAMAHKEIMLQPRKT